MLKLTRRLNESILLTIDDDADPEQLAAALREGISITLCDIAANRKSAGIGIQAPGQVRILRAELLQ
ncbi:MAG: carbon storage regulator [Pseudomonas sp.]|nr:carbon storage regulator [Pseudomonas sp.]